MRAEDEVMRLQRKISEGSMSPDEPLFVLRGQDMCSYFAIIAWVNMATQLGTDQESVDEALVWADELKAWPTKRVPRQGGLAPTTLHEE